MKKDVLCMAIGTLATGLFGSWGPLYYALLVCQAIDLVAGLMVAGVFNKSNKSENGRIDSAAMFKGLCRKFAMWAVIASAAKAKSMAEAWAYCNSFALMVRHVSPLSSE